MNQYTKNRKLMLNEYDDDGNLIDTREFNEKELMGFLNLMYSTYKPLRVARAEHLNQFTNRELQAIDKIINNSQIFAIYGGSRILEFETDEDIQYFKNLFNDCPIELVEFILDINKSFRNTVPYSSFFDTIEIFKEKTGMYYTVDNQGNKKHIYSDTPTLKQYRYHIKRNNARTVFLNFNDWKEYIVNESDLK